MIIKNNNDTDLISILITSGYEYSIESNRFLAKVTDSAPITGFCAVVVNEDNSFTSALLSPLVSSSLVLDFIEEEEEEYLTSVLN